MFKFIKNQKTENINVVEGSNCTQIDINKETSMFNYVKYFDEKNIKLDVPAGILITDSYDLLRANILKQKIFIFKYSMLQFYIAISSNEIRISEYEVINNEINEIMIGIKKEDNDYYIIKSIHDINKSTKSFKRFNKADDANENLSEIVTLKKEDAFCALKKLFENIKIIKDIEKLLDFNELYNIFDLDYEDVINKSK